MEVEEIPLRKVETDIGVDVAEYTSFRDGMRRLAGAISALSTELAALDEKVAKDLNTLGKEVEKAKRNIKKVERSVKELEDGVSKALEDVKDGLSKISDKISNVFEERLSKVEVLVEKKTSSILEGLKEHNISFSELASLVRSLALRVEFIEARLDELEKRLGFLSLVAEGVVANWQRKP